MKVFLMNKMKMTLGFFFFLVVFLNWAIGKIEDRFPKENFYQDSFCFVGQPRFVEEKRESKTGLEEIQQETAQELKQTNKQTKTLNNKQTKNRFSWHHCVLNQNTPHALPWPTNNPARRFLLFFSSSQG